MSSQALGDLAKSISQALQDHCHGPGVLFHLLPLPKPASVKRAWEPPAKADGKDAQLLTPPVQERRPISAQSICWAFTSGSAVRSALAAVGFQALAVDSRECISLAATRLVAIFLSGPGF